MIKPRGADPAKCACQFHRGLIRAFEKIVIERQLVELRRDSFLDAVLAITQIAAPQTRHTVLNLVAVRVKDIDVLSTTDNSATLMRIILKISKWMQVVCPIKIFKGCCVQTRRHAGFSPKRCF